MLKNTAIKIAGNKIANTSLLPGSLILVGGIVIWRLWSKQTQLQTETSKLSIQIKTVKRQLAEMADDGSSKTPLSSTFKKFFGR